MCTYVGIQWKALHRKVGITQDWITGHETRLACCRLLHLVPSHWGIISANQWLSYVETCWVLWRDNLWSTRSLTLIHWIAMKTVDIQFLNTTEAWAIILSSVCMVSMENTNSETRFEKEAKGNSEMAHWWEYDAGLKFSPVAFKYCSFEKGCPKKVHKCTRQDWRVLWETINLSFPWLQHFN